MRKEARAAVITAALALLIPSPGSTSAPRVHAAVDHSGTHAQVRDALIHDRSITVGDHSLYLRCMGAGSPTVILDDAGFVEEWMDVQRGIARFTHVCTYDREGLGLSTAGPAPTSSAALADDLHALVDHAHLRPPFVLAGHAFGGDTVLLYAAQHPEEVSGLVLADAIPPALMRHGLAQNTDDVDFRASRRQVGAIRSLGSIPLAVLTHGIPYSYPQSVERPWPRLQNTLAHLSTEHVLATVPSGQNIPAVLPGVVVYAVRQVIRAANAPGTSLQEW